MGKLLTICILTLPNRVESLTHLLKQLTEQIERYGLNDVVEVLYLGDNKSLSVGDKRNQLIEMATGENVAFVDDDDEVSENYINALWEAISFNPHLDVYNFVVQITQCGKDPKPVYYSKDFLKDQNFKAHYHRIPNHLSAVKRSLALKVGYKGVNYQEDADYSKRLLPHLRNELNIAEVLYFYKANPYTSETLPEKIRKQVIKFL